MGGNYRVAGLGGSQVGPFTASGHIPAPAMLNTPQLAGAALTADAYGTYNFYWTGGDDDSYVVGRSLLSTGTSKLLPPRWAPPGPFQSRLWTSIVAGDFTFIAMVRFQPASPLRSSLRRHPSG
jgi:hypothetical protein